MSNTPNNGNRSRKVRFPNNHNLPKYNRLTKNDYDYMEVVKSMYNNPAIQREFVNSLNISNASKTRIKNALNANGNNGYTRNLRNSRRSIVESMGRRNIPILKTLRRRHTNIAKMENELQYFPISQERKNAILRRLKEGIGRQHFGVEDSHTLAKILAESDNPIALLKRVRELPVSPEKQRQFMRQILYIFDGAIPVKEYTTFKNVYNNAIRENMSNPLMESVVADSGAFD